MDKANIFQHSQFWNFCNLPQLNARQIFFTTFYLAQGSIVVSKYIELN